MALRRTAEAAGLQSRPAMKPDLVGALAELPRSTLHEALESGLKLIELRLLCERSGIPSRGRKSELVNRLLGPTQRGRRDADAVTRHDEDGTESGRWRSFVEARAFAHRLRFQSESGWHAYEGALPPDVPPDPDRVYAAAGWGGWADFLGMRASAQGEPRRKARARPKLEHHRRARQRPELHDEHRRSTRTAPRPARPAASPSREAMSALVGSMTVRELSERTGRPIAAIAAYCLDDHMRHHTTRG